MKRGSRSLGRIIESPLYVSSSIIRNFFLPSPGGSFWGVLLAAGQDCFYEGFQAGLFQIGRTLQLHILMHLPTAFQQPLWIRQFRPPINPQFNPFLAHNQRTHQSFVAGAVTVGQEPGRFINRLFHPRNSIIVLWFLPNNVLSSNPQILMSYLLARIPSPTPQPTPMPTLDPLIPPPNSTCKLVGSKCSHPPVIVL